ncbi:MAG: methionine synthase [Nitrospinota bacterium]
MSRSKLEALGLKLPLLPTTTVGSFPKPDYLKEARIRYARGEIDQEELRALEERATTFWIETQEELGLDVVVDGEMYRGDMVAFFAETLEGFTLGGLVRSYGNRYYKKPIITGPVRWPGPVTVEWWRFAQERTERPVKGMLTGPYTIMDWSFNEYYPTRADATLALAKEVRKEVEALAEAGAKIIQIDEPALSTRPEELPLATEAMEIVTQDMPVYFITHICYGAFEFIYPGMLALPVDNFDLEMSNSELDLLDLFEGHPFTKDFSFGCLDVHSHKIERLDQVDERLKRVLGCLPAEQIWVDPDCGLKTRTVEEAVEKLQVMVEGARGLREILAG